MQLFIKAVQLIHSRPELKDNFILRIGELHEVFAQCKAIGKYIDGSGLDALFTHCDIFGPNAVARILEGKHMIRCVRFYLVIYCSIIDIMIEDFFEKNHNLADQVKQLCREASSKPSKEECGKFTKDLSVLGFYKEFNSYREGLNNQGKFLNNVVQMIEGLLLTLRSSRQQLWNLKLASRERFVKYYFALDLLNYARMTPIELSSLFDLQKSDRESWDFLVKNHSVNKTKGSFVAVGVDHALEQINRELKAYGGVIGMTERSLDKYIYAAPVRNILLARFDDEFKMTSHLGGSDFVHHEDTGSHSEFQMKNFLKYSEALKERLGGPISELDTVFNIMTGCVLENSTELLEIAEIGETMHRQFLNERKSGEDKGVFDPMKKRKLVTFKTASKTITVKLANKLVKLKEERNFTSKLLVIMRTRPDIDIRSRVVQGT